MASYSHLRDSYLAHINMSNNVKALCRVHPLSSSKCYCVFLELLLELVKTGVTS